MATETLMKTMLIEKYKNKIIHIKMGFWHGSVNYVYIHEWEKKNHFIILYKIL